MRPRAANVTHRPTITDHDRLAVSIGETLVQLTDSERVRALAAIPAEALDHLGISVGFVLRQRPRFAPVCSYCAGKHEVAECPNFAGRRELRPALAR